MKKSQLARQERNAQLVKNIVEATKPLLLQQGYEDLTIREIAERMGYSTSSNFTVFFKNAVGITPLEYRQKGNRKY